MANNSKDTSPYFNTPVTGWYLDIMVSLDVPKSAFDKIVRIPPAYDERPDLMSQAEYGTPKLWWVFAVRNPNDLVDPIADFKAGLEIYIPANILK
jgi:hypothetical protein